MKINKTALQVSRFKKIDIICPLIRNGISGIAINVKGEGNGK